MTRRPLLLVLAAVLPVLGTAGLPPFSSAAPPSQEQQTPSPPRLQGVVWTPPQAPGPALQQLNRIDAMGATAVRLTRLPPADTLFAHADSLGLALFIDLPVSFVPAASLRDSLRAARPQVKRLRRLSERHPSIQAVGLAHGANTTRPAACPVLADWTDRLQEWPRPPATYYVTPFAAAADRCGDAVDRVLIDVRGQEAPLPAYERWGGTGVPVGLGALGTWVRSTARRGLRVPHSPERQARHLETALGTLLDTTQTAPPVFVHRWQDRTNAPLPMRRYGLRTRGDSLRPAARVVEGFYRDVQRVFAFPDGTSPGRTPLGPLLVTWILVGLLGGLYARNPFVRQTVGRYFAAPGFYRDAVRKGRDVHTPETVLLLGAVGTAVGLIGMLAARIAAVQPITGALLDALPAAVAAPVAAGLAQPAFAGGFVGGLCVIVLGGWALLLVGTARLDGPFTIGQGLMLVTWPCWPTVPGLLIALVAATDPPVSPGILGLVLLVGGLLTTLVVSTRVLHDFWRVSGVDAPWIAVLTLPSPLVVLGVFFTVVTLEYDLPLRLLWHLLTRT